MNNAYYEWEANERQREVARDVHQREQWHLDGGRLSAGGTVISLVKRLLGKQPAAPQKAAIVTLPETNDKPSKRAS